MGKILANSDSAERKHTSDGDSGINVVLKSDSQQASPTATSAAANAHAGWLDANVGADCNAGEHPK
jgi:hypothetical protein